VVGLGLRNSSQIGLWFGLGLRSPKPSRTFGWTWTSKSNSELGSDFGLWAQNRTLVKSAAGGSDFGFGLGLRALPWATPAARDPNFGSGNHDMPRLSKFAYPDDAPIRGLADIHLAYSQRILGAAPSPLAPSSQASTHGNTRCSRPKPRRWQPRHA
jgi:hypothetical protein